MTLTAGDLKQIADTLGAEVDPADVERYRPRYNIAPTDLHWVLVGDRAERRIIPAVWGLTHKRLIVNLRAETVRHGAFSHHAPCLAIADGFYEWRRVGRERRPIWYRSARGGLLLLAGLDEPITGKKAGTAFTILTTQANADVAPVHDRMPVVVPAGRADEIDAWLARRSPELLAPAPAGALVAQEVSMRVNQVANDDPACLGPPESPAPPEPESPQRSFRF